MRTAEMTEVKIHIWIDSLWGQQLIVHKLVVDLYDIDSYHPMN